MTIKQEPGDSKAAPETRARKRRRAATGSSTRKRQQNRRPTDGDVATGGPGAAPPLSKTNCASIGKCKAMWEREFGHPDGKCAPEAASHGVCEIGGYG